MKANGDRTSCPLCFHSTRAHRWIIGYICHELRNPLHVLKSTMGTLIEASAGKGQGLPRIEVGVASPQQGVGASPSVRGPNRPPGLPPQHHSSGGSLSPEGSDALVSEALPPPARSRVMSSSTTYVVMSLSFHPVLAWFKFITVVALPPGP